MDLINTTSLILFKALDIQNIFCVLRTKENDTDLTLHKGK